MGNVVFWSLEEPLVELRARARSGAREMLLLLLKFGFVGGVHGWARAAPERGWL